jgi:hypothetical protein
VSRLDPGRGVVVVARPDLADSALVLRQAARVDVGHSSGGAKAAVAGRALAPGAGAVLALRRPLRWNQIAELEPKGGYLAGQSKYTDRRRENEREV